MCWYCPTGPGRFLYILLARATYLLMGDPHKRRVVYLFQTLDDKCESEACACESVVSVCVFACVLVCL